MAELLIRRLSLVPGSRNGHRSVVMIRGPEMTSGMKRCGKHDNDIGMRNEDADRTHSSIPVSHFEACTHHFHGQSGIPFTTLLIDYQCQSLDEASDL